MDTWINVFSEGGNHNASHARFLGFSGSSVCRLLRYTSKSYAWWHTPQMNTSLPPQIKLVKP